MANWIDPSNNTVVTYANAIVLRQQKLVLTRRPSSEESRQGQDDLTLRVAALDYHTGVSKQGMQVSISLGQKKRKICWDGRLSIGIHVITLVERVGLSIKIEVIDTNRIRVWLICDTNDFLNQLAQGRSADMLNVRG